MIQDIKPAHRLHLFIVVLIFSIFLDGRNQSAAAALLRSTVKSSARQINAIVLDNRTLMPMQWRTLTSCCSKAAAALLFHARSFDVCLTRRIETRILVPVKWIVCTLCVSQHLSPILAFCNSRTIACRTQIDPFQKMEMSLLRKVWCMHKQSGLYYFHAVLYTQTSFIPMQSCSCLPRTRGWWCEGLFRRNHLGTHGCCYQLHYTCMQSSDVLATYWCNSKSFVFQDKRRSS